MNALDQAFIKAYSQHGNGGIAAPPTTAPAAALAGAAAPRAGAATVAPEKATLTSVLAALSQPPHRGGDSPAPLAAAATVPPQVDREPANLPAAAPPTTRGAAGKWQTPAGARTRAKKGPSLAELGVCEAIYRVDAGRPAPVNPNLEIGGSPIPPPHLSVLKPETLEEADPTPSGEPADADGTPLAPTGAGAESLRPMLHVDRFAWPRTCTRLMTVAAKQLDQLSDELLLGQARGKKVLAIAGCRRGEGSTTMLLCAARRLADRGQRVVMVDADLADPQLARRLGVLPQFGWESVCTGQLPLAEVLIGSVENPLALLPLRESSASSTAWLEGKAPLSKHIDALATQYDFVLVDLGPLEDPAVLSGSFGRELSRRLDGIILVQNVRIPARERLAEVQRRLATAGIVQAGIIENRDQGREAEE